jgi:proton-translocating NADH-quinone oxidoreductase chain M
MLTPLLDALILFTFTTPLAGLVGRKIGHEKTAVAAYATSSLLLSLTLILLFYSDVLRGVSFLAEHASALPPEGSSLEADALSTFLAAIFLIIGSAACVFSVGEIEEGRITGYYTVLLGIVTAMVGVVFSGDLFTLFVFWEVMCICSYTLVAFKTERWESIEASFKYLIMSSAGSITALFALSFLYGQTGTLNIAYLSVSLQGSSESLMVYFALLMLIVGFGLQAGMVPFHMWLPDAHMAAPSSISAILSGVMVKAGIYGLLRVLLVIFLPLQGSWRFTLAAFAVLTMFIGNLSALPQDDIKRLLAYSTIANSGYILLGIAIGSHRAITGSLFHVLNHALIKALLFLCAGGFTHRTGTRSLKELAGIRREMPLTGAAFIIGTLSLASIPPLNIFWSELTIITAGVEAGMSSLSFLMVLNLVFSAAYCLRMIQAIALKRETSTSKKAREAPLQMLIPILVLVLLSIIVGVYPTPFQTLAETAAQTISGTT